MSTRSEKAAVAVRLRAEGKTAREIAAVLGVSISYASGLYTDPTGEKDRARKASYAGTCEGCGAKTTGCNGRALAPKLCAPCLWQTEEYKTRNLIWSRDVIVARIREWAEIYGEPPAMGDWNSWLAEHTCNDHERAARFDADTHWPWSTDVARKFGTWNAAIQAAGFEPRANHGGGGNGQRQRSARARQAA